MPRPRPIRHRSRRGASGLAVLAVLALAACAPQRAFEAARLLAALAPESGAAEAGDRSAGGVRRLALAGGSPPGDLYLADMAPEAALVLVPGLVPEGKDDPRLVAFAGALADARFAVFVPELPNFRAQRASAADALVIAGAVERLARCFPPGVRPGLGLAAISYAVGPALIAARDHDPHRRVRLIVAIGGYYSATAVVTFFTTGYLRDGPDRPWRHREPNAYGKWVFVLTNADRLEDPADRRALAAIAARKLQDPEAEVGDLAARLGPAGRSVMALVDNRDPERVPELVAALPAPVRYQLRALDPAARGLEGLKAELILVHGRDDPIIPASESEALAAAVPRGRAALFIVDSLRHVELELGGIGDAIRLWRAAYRLLAARDALPRPDPAWCLGERAPETGPDDALGPARSPPAQQPSGHQSPSTWSSVYGQVSGSAGGGSP